MNVLTPVQRQLNMSRIRSRDTQPGWRVVMAWECWGATIILAGRTTNMMAGGEESKAA